MAVRSPTPGSARGDFRFQNPSPARMMRILSERSLEKDFKMKIGKFCLLVAVGCALLLPGPVEAERIKPEGHPFSVDVPGKAEHQEQSRSIGFGTVDSESYVINDSRNAIFVSIITLPGFASAFTPSSVLYSQTRDEMLEDIGGQQVEFRDFERDGHEGKLLLYEIADGEKSKRRGRAEFFRVSSAMYLFAAHGEDINQDTRDTFFASLKIDD